MSVVVNPSSGLTFVELAGTDTYTILANSVWEDWDLSAIIPANTKAVVIESPPGLLNSGVRQNGSAADRRLTTYGATFIALHAARIVECRCDLLGNVFSLMGYWV